MKNLIAITIALFTLVAAGLAQTTAPLTISGTVAPIATITMASQSGYNTLDLVNGATAQLVGIAKETCNDKLGYKVTLPSANAAATAQAVLKGAISGNPDSVNYSIIYNAVPVTLVSGSATVTTAVAKTGAAGLQKNLAVTLAGGWLTADTYSDTITLTIAWN